MKLTGITKRSGFTLIEIIIVVVILGILAAIALPKVTENIDKARAAEAFNFGSDFGKAFSRCLSDESGGIAVNATHVGNCNAFTEVNMTDPNGISTNFTYALSTNSTDVRLLMSMKGALGGLAADIIDFTFDGINGDTQKGCGGKFSKMCKN